MLGEVLEMQISALVTLNLLAIILAVIAEYMHRCLRNATHNYEIDTGHMKSTTTLEFPYFNERNSGAESSHSFRLSSICGGLFWNLLYTVIWSLVGLLLGYSLAILVGVNLPIYIVFFAVSMARGMTAVGKASNARTDRKYTVEWSACITTKGHQIDSSIEENNKSEGSIS